MSRLTLTASQRHRLERQLRQTKDAGVFQRTFAILEAAAGRLVAEIARLLRTSRVSVYHWLDRYGQTPDPSILADRRGGNHPSLWTEELQAALLATLERRPEQFGYQAVEWTVPLLCEHLEEWRGECLSETSVRRQLHDLGYVWKRPRYRLDPDPEREKKHRIRKEIAALPPRWVTLFEDETDLLLFPPLRGAWGLRGQRREVRISGTNARRVVFGTINIATGYRLFLPRRRQRGEDFRAFLPVLANHYRGWHIALLLDEDPCHTADASQRLARYLGMRLIWLPKRCPELNGMDHLWGHGKDHMCANKQYETIDGEVERFIRYLQGLPSREALVQAGIRSDDFWLRV